VNAYCYCKYTSIQFSSQLCNDIYLGEEEDPLATVRNKHIVRHIVVLQPNASTGNHICQVVQCVPSLKYEASHRIIYQLGYRHPTLHCVFRKRDLVGRCLLDRERH
jgi:hypothetical protein